jgi:hypothetical protein
MWNKRSIVQARIFPDYQTKVIRHREKTKKQEAGIENEIEHHLKGKDPVCLASKNEENYNIFETVEPDAKRNKRRMQGHNDIPTKKTKQQLTGMYESAMILNRKFEKASEEKKSKKEDE